jgi:ribosomal protein L11 methyltransferase
LRILPSDENESRDAIVAALFECGAQAVVEDGREIVTHFPPGSDLVAIRSALQGADSGAAISQAPVADKDWSIAWRDRLAAHNLGAITVAPPWLADGLDPARTVVIEPEMAFGTGDHESTRGVLRLMPSMLVDGDVVADLGAGSAVLSIAAAKLGARRVYAIESDADAIGNANVNVHANNVADRVHVLEGDAFALLPLVSPVQLVLANIISSVLRLLLPIIKDSLNARGRVILSGLLLSERAEWCVLLEGQAWHILDESSEGDWWTVAIAKT